MKMHELPFSSPELASFPDAHFGCTCEAFLLRLNFSDVIVSVMSSHFNYMRKLFSLLHHFLFPKWCLEGMVLYL